MSMSQNQEPTREGIRRLIALLRKYEPLVNESGEVYDFQEKGSGGAGLMMVNHERNDLIKTATGAIQDIAGFIQHFERTKSNYTALREDVTTTHQRLQSLGIDEPSLANGLEVLVGRLNKAEDVLKNIANNLPADKTKDAATRFLAFRGKTPSAPPLSVVTQAEADQGEQAGGPESSGQ